MLDFIKILLYFFSVLSVGFLVLKIINPACRLNLRNFALLYGIGCASITLEMFFFSLAGIKFSLPAILSFWLLLSLFMFVKNRDSLKNYLTDKLVDILNFNKEKIFNLNFLAISFFAVI
ncbi:MAG: hypothetical protein DRP74_07155, partial [Candidatus Omnitrophota bacterium]